jgi:hypothetical protein
MIKNEGTDEFRIEWHDPRELPNEVRGFIYNLYRILVELHPAINRLRFAFIISMKDAPEQTQHADNESIVLYKYDNVRVPIEQIPFSMIFDVEHCVDNKSYLRVKNKLVLIPPGGYILFRGDCRHSGVAYNKQNIRLFVGVGTTVFPWDPDKVILYRDV